MYRNPNLTKAQISLFRANKTVLALCNMGGQCRYGSKYCVMLLSYLNLGCNDKSLFQKRYEH